MNEPPLLACLPFQVHTFMCTKNSFYYEVNWTLPCMTRTVSTSDICAPYRLHMPFNSRVKKIALLPDGSYGKARTQ